MPCLPANVIPEEMDKKLLLTMQYSCNLAGLAVPWNDIGSIMGTGISGGAVIQHLAKLRIRMVKKGLDVPPPLRRGGGGSRISTSASSSSKVKATPAKKGTATTKKPKKAKKKVDPGSDGSEDDNDTWVDDDSDEEYGEPPAKRAKSNGKDAMRPRKMKTEDSDEEVATPTRPSKRKHQSTKSSPRQSHDEDEIKTEFAATGATWLSLEDDDASHPKTGKKTPYKKPSFVISLPYSPHKTGMVGGLKEEDTDHMSDNESEDEMVGRGIDKYVGGSHVLSHEGPNDEISTLPYSQHLEAQVNQAPVSTSNNGMYHNAYNTSPHSMPLNGAFADTSNNLYYNSTILESNDSIFENNGLVQNQTVGQSGAFGGNDGGNFELGQISTSFNDQGAGFPDLNGVFGGDFNQSLIQAGSFGNGGMSSGNVQQEAFAYQASNGYGTSSNAFGNNVNGLPGFDEHNHAQAIPYPIQTSWPSNHISAGASNKTSEHPTPADTSAGADVGGYFGDSGHFDFRTFDDATVDYSTNDGSNVLFGSGNFDGNRVGGGFFGSDAYSN